MRRTDKRSSSKYIFLGVLFIATMVVTFLSMGLETVTPSATTMTEATLPVISMLTDEGTEFNPLHGYTAAINQALTNDSLTPIAQNRKLDIVIYSYGADVQEVSYKVRSLSDNSLIENTKVNTLNRDDNKITATLGIKNLIDDNVQYALEIMIKTSAHDEIYYYTRIVTGENYENRSNYTNLAYAHIVRWHGVPEKAEEKRIYKADSCHHTDISHQSEDHGPKQQRGDKCPEA